MGLEERLECLTCRTDAPIRCPKHWRYVSHDPECTAGPGDFDIECPRCERAVNVFEAEKAAVQGGPPSVEAEARGLVDGPRQSSYAHPNQDFRTTGRQWAAVIENWLKAEGHDFDVPDIPPRIVALMMTNLKISRESQRHGRDNLVDGIGYLICAAKNTGEE